MTLQQQELVSMKAVKNRLKGTYSMMTNSKLNDWEADEIMLRLKLFGIISITDDRSKMNDRYEVELNIFLDEIKIALEKDKLIIDNHIQF